jgi:L-ascorbate metabolism protein UlaG (beta-lactamase superfamily)
MKKLIISIAVSIFCYNLTFSQVESNDLHITYIANEGFLLATKEHKVLIDALFSDGYGLFSCPTIDVINQIMSATPPFDNVSLCFLTHYHKDHSDSKLMKDYLQKYPDVKLVTTKPSLVFIDGEQFGFVKLKKQFSEITPKINKSISQQVNDVPIKVLGLKHLSYYQDGVDLEEYMFNVGFYIDLDGFKILHAGDTNLENLRDFINKNGQWTDPVDVAFLYYEMLNEGKSALDYITKILNPKYIILMHLPPTHYKEWSDKTNQLKQSFPNIILFNNSLESKLIHLN